MLLGLLDGKKTKAGKNHKRDVKKEQVGKESLKRRKINQEPCDSKESSFKLEFVRGGIAPPPVRSYPVEKNVKKCKINRDLLVENKNTKNNIARVKHVKSDNDNSRQLSKMNGLKAMRATIAPSEILTVQPNLQSDVVAPKSDASKDLMVSNHESSSTKPLLLGIGRKKKSARPVSNSSVHLSKRSCVQDGSNTRNKSSFKDQGTAASVSFSSSMNIKDSSHPVIEAKDSSKPNSNEQPGYCETDINFQQVNQQSDQSKSETSLLDNKVKEIKHASWYNPQEHAQLKFEANDNLRIQQEIKNSKKTNSVSSSSGINDNYVKLDLRNSAGSCRGARNLKKVNKQKAWRAKYRFGMSDGPIAEGDDETRGQARKRGKSNAPSDNEKHFLSKNGGVDPLDDFMDGVFSSKNKGAKSGVVCTRHSRPCKLMTVKRNHKGNKGRKFYVCSMPVGEKCDFFKWEEDTVEVRVFELMFLEIYIKHSFVLIYIFIYDRQHKELCFNLRQILGSLRDRL